MVAFGNGRNHYGRDWAGGELGRKRGHNGGGEGGSLGTELQPCCHARPRRRVDCLGCLQAAHMHQCGSPLGHFRGSRARSGVFDVGGVAEPLAQVRERDAALGMQLEPVRERTQGRK